MKSVETICQCGNCGKTFYLDERKEKKKMLYGINIVEKVCPYCNSLGITRLKDVNFLNKFLVNKKEN